MACITRRTLSVAAGLMISSGVMLSSGALAADMIPSMGEPMQATTPTPQLEFGSGWYLRADMGWVREKKPVLYPDGTLGGVAKTVNGWSGTLGYGYKYNNWLRLDMTFDYRPDMASNLKSSPFSCPIEIRGLNDSVSGNPVGVYAVNNQCYSQQTAKLNRSVVLGNAYFDLGTWYGITPYLGVGVGTSYARVRSSYDWYDMASNTKYQPTLTLPGGYPIIWMDAYGNPVPPPVSSFGTQNKYMANSQRVFNFAYAGMAGVAIDVSPNAKIDIGYRYLNMGKLTSASKASVVQEIRAGVRYMID